MSTATIKIKPKNPKTRWVILDKKNKIIVEAKTPEEAIKKIGKIRLDQTLAFVPKPNVKYFL